MEVTLHVNLEKFRYNLVGDGYLLEEVKNLTTEQLVDILDDIINEFDNKHNDEFNWKYYN